MSFPVSLCCFLVLDKKNSTESINHEGEEQEVRHALALFTPGFNIHFSLIHSQVVNAASHELHLCKRCELKSLLMCIEIVTRQPSSPFV